MNNQFYSPHEDSSINPNLTSEEVNFQEMLFDTIIDDIVKHGYDYNRYTKNVKEVKYYCDEMDGDTDKAALIIADVNGVDFHDIAFDPTFQVYFAVARTLSNSEEQ